MKRHLEKCDPYQKLVAQRRGQEREHPQNQFINELMGWTDPTRAPVMTSLLLKERVLRILISGNLPFAFVENSELISLMRDAYPSCEMPSRKTMVDYLSIKAQETKSELRDMLNKNTSRISLAMDVWTTRTNLSFLGIAPFLIVFFFKELKAWAAM